MKSISTLFLTLVFAATPVAPVFAEDATDPAAPELTMEEESKFASRELLTETFLGAELAALSDAEAAVSGAQMALDEALATQAGIPALEQAVMDAQTALDAAVAGGTATAEEIALLEQGVVDAQMALDEAVASAATPEEIAALEMQLAEAQGSLDALNSQVGSTTALIDQLSDAQVLALNRALNNALNSKLPLVYDAAMLQPIVDGNYNRHQINAYTQGLEQEARFLAKADGFQAKYDESGQERFLTKVERFTSWAQAQKDKFFAKVERFADKDEVGPHGDAVEDEVDSALADAAEDDARGAAKQVARAAARDAAKQAAKDAASKEARRVARAEAKDAVKQAGKSAEDKGKGKKGS